MQVPFNKDLESLGLCLRLSLRAGGDSLVLPLFRRLDRVWRTNKTSLPEASQFPAPLCSNVLSSTLDAGTEFQAKGGNNLQDRFKARTPVTRKGFVEAFPR